MTSKVLSDKMLHALHIAGINAISTSRPDICILESKFNRITYIVEFDQQKPNHFYLIANQQYDASECMSDVELETYHKYIDTAKHVINSFVK